MESIVEELQRPVVFDESFERRVMVRVRRLNAERKRRQPRLIQAATAISRRPAWAAAIAAGLIAVVTFGVLRTRPGTEHVVVSGSAEPVTFVYVAPNARSVKVVGDFNNWGLNDASLVAKNNRGVCSVTASIP